MNKIKDILANITKVEVGTWIRFVLMVIAMVNTLLQMFGVNTIPVIPDQISLLVSGIFTILVWVNNYWKNNSFTGAALAADKVMKRLRKQEICSTVDDEGGKFDV